jgi:hypothetical protein
MSERLNDESTADFSQAVDRTVKNTMDAMKLLRVDRLSVSPTPSQTIKNAKAAMELLRRSV